MDFLSGLGVESHIIHFLKGLLQLYSAGAKHVDYSACQYLDVEPQAPVIDIPGIELQTLTEGREIPSIDLCPSSHSRRTLCRRFCSVV